MSTYNGHKNWNRWNVSLWLMNDEGLYRQVEQALNDLRTSDDTARALAAQLKGKSTPDGAPYTFTTIRAAIRDMKRTYRGDAPQIVQKSKWVSC
jgi:hypothetical protein